MSIEGSSLITCLKANPAKLRRHKRSLLADIRLELANARSDEERALLREIRAAVVTNTTDIRRTSYSWIAAGFIRKIRRLFPT